MSSSTVYEPLRRNRWWTDHDGAYATTIDEDDDIRVVWDLTDYLASSETVSSAAYADSGASTSSKSVSSPQVIFTMTKTGETKVTATLSTGRTLERVFRTYAPSGARPSDYR